MRSIPELRQVYDDFLDWACGWLSGNGYELNSVRAKARSGGENLAIVETGAVLHCKNWPYSARKTKKLDVLVSLSETVSLADGACSKSTLMADYYFWEEHRLAVFARGLRYDCVVPRQNKHPICHVHVTNQQIFEYPESFQYDRVRLANVKSHERIVRIPSAFVNLPGFFAILAGDHMRDEHWKEFSIKCGEHVALFPVVQDHIAVKRAVQKANLNACGWYEA